MSAKVGRRVVRPEDLLKQFEDMLALVETQTQRMRALPGLVSTRGAQFPESSDQLRAGLLAALEDEVVPAIETESGGIRQAEVDREIIKKALTNLKLPALRKVAKSTRLASLAGTIEQLAERVAAEFEWDETRIARLILENEEVVSPERGYTTRFFPVDEGVDLPHVRERLSYVAGRYIRIGVAKWFVFDEIIDNGDDFELAGSLRAYSAHVDSRGIGGPQLATTSTQDVARLFVDAESLLEIRNANAATARGAAQALSTAADVRPLGRIPFIDPKAPSGRNELHSASQFMLDLLVNRLPASGLGDINLIVARFQVRAPKESAWDVEVDRVPTLRAVRFEGEFLTGSAPACELLATEQRPLTDITAQITTRSVDGTISGRFPMRITIERDHIAIETSFGFGNLELSQEVHSKAVAAVQAEIVDGHGNADNLATVTERIFDNARRGGGAVDVLSPMPSEPEEEQEGGGVFRPESDEAPNPWQT